jgi:hypothetical protein
VVVAHIMVVAAAQVDFFGMDLQLQQKPQMVPLLHITTAQHIQYLLVLVVLPLDLIRFNQNEVIVELPQL